MTLQEQREFILSGLERLQKINNQNDFGGYFDCRDLQGLIFRAIGAQQVKVRIKSQYRGYYTERTYRAEDWYKVREIIRRLEEQGFVKASQSGKAYKVLKTK